MIEKILLKRVKNEVLKINDDYFSKNALYIQVGVRNQFN